MIPRHRLSSALSAVLLIFAVTGVVGDSVLYNNAAYESGALGLSPTQSYLSSNLTPVEFNILAHNTSSDSSFSTEGYVFIAPVGSVAQPGSAIFDTDGHLVWSSYEDFTPGSENFQVVTYKGEDHLAFWSGTSGICAALYGCFSYGHDILLDKNYQVVANVTTTGLVNGTLADLHEFNVQPDGTALLTAYPPRAWNLSAWNISGQGWIADGVAQEIDIATGKAIFTWYAADHVDLTECYTTPTDQGGAPQGGSFENAWDWFHINSIDKDSLGNYLINSRYCKSSFYVAPSGEILWRLGGKNSSFKFENTDATFSFQHHPRFREGNLISLFDNAATAFEIDEPYSRGLLLDVDRERWTVSLVQDYLPYNRTPSESQGDFQLLETGHWVAGWGQNAYVSEYDADGSLIWAAQFGISSDVQSYRNYRFNWKGYPLTDPSFVIVNGTGYVSWNGATEVKNWQLLGSKSTTASKSHSSSKSLYKTPKTGFETVLPINGTAVGYGSYAVAGLDAEGNVLGTSALVRA